jgi:hypothetical protein
MCHTALLSLIFIAFGVLDSIMSYGRSKRVINVDGFGGLNFWKGSDVDVLISSKRIKIMLPGIIRNTLLFIFEI